MGQNQLKKINIFLASSITELESDRDKFEAFINRLNDFYVEIGVRIYLYRCETGDIAISSEAGGKQAEYDRKIRESDLCIFLFFKKLGDYTRHEFEVALDSFRNSDKPKIVTFFKYVTTPAEATEEIKGFMQLLDKEIRHYYNVYQNIDTLKLGILMQLKLMKLDSVEPNVENGKVMLGTTEIADTSKVPIFAGNDSLSQYREELKKLNELCEELTIKRHENPDDEELYSECFEASSRRKEVEQAIKEIETSVLKMTKVITESTDRGNLSPRQVLAYRALEQGDYSLALEVLDFDAIMADLAHNEEMGEGYIERIQLNANELIQRIDVLKAKGINENTAKEIKDIYQIVYARIEQFNLDKSPLYDYASFLYNQNEYESALDVASILKYYYAHPKLVVEESDKAKLYILLGIIYCKQNKFKEGEENLLAAVKIYKNLEHENSSVYEPDLAVSYINLGDLYCDLCRFDEAEKNFSEAVEICKRLAVEDPLVYEPNLADSYHSISILYINTNRYEKAEENLLLALKIYQRLDEEKPSKYASYLAEIYNKLGITYSRIGRFKDTEESYSAALKIYKRLAAENPSQYDPMLANSYNNLGQFYDNLSRYDQSVNRYNEAEENLFSALKIYKRLAKENPSAYEPLLAYSYNNIGVLYMDLQRYEEAQKYLLDGLEIRTRLAKENPATFEPEEAGSYNNLGIVYDKISRYKEAEMCYKAAISVYKRLAEKDPSAYEPVMTMVYYNLGVIYNKTNRFEEFQSAFFEAYYLAKEHLDNFYCNRIYNSIKGLFED